MMKRLVIAVLATLSLFVLPSVSASAAESQDKVSAVLGEKEHADMEQVMEGFDLGQMSRAFLLYNHSDIPKFVLGTSEEGYLILDRDTGAFLEKAEGADPFYGYEDEVKYYGGIGLYFIQTDDGFLDLLREDTVEELPYIEAIDDMGVAESGIGQEGLLSALSPGSLSSSTLSSNSSSPSTENQLSYTNSLVRRLSFGLNDEPTENTCTAVASGLVLNCLDRMVDGDIVPNDMEAEELESDEWNATSYAATDSLHQSLVYDCGMEPGVLGVWGPSVSWYFANYSDSSAAIAATGISCESAIVNPAVPESSLVYHLYRITSSIDRDLPVMMTTTLKTPLLGDYEQYGQHTMMICGYDTELASVKVHTGWYGESRIQKIGNTYYSTLVEIPLNIAIYLYYFDFNPGLHTGGDGNLRYFDSDLDMLTGWQTIAGSDYYFGSDGVMKTGLQVIGGKRYVFDGNGVALVGFQDVSSSRYYLRTALDTPTTGPKYSAVTGWLTLSGVTRYFYSDGRMATGSLYMGDYLYYFNPLTGALQSTTFLPYAAGGDTSPYVSAAATRDAMPAAELLGLSGMEESYQFVDMSNWPTSLLRDANGNLQWGQPKYVLIAGDANAIYNIDPNPFAWNLFNDPQNPQMIDNPIRGGGGNGPDSALAAYQSGDSTDDAVWELMPDVIIGDNGGAADAQYATSAAAVDPNYSPTPVTYSFSNNSGLIDTMYSIAAAGDAKVTATKSLRYGSVMAIARNYERYIRGTQGYILSQLADEDTGIPAITKTFAAISGYDADTGLYTVLATSGSSGTASQNRYIEAVQYVANNYNTTTSSITATAAQLANVDLFLIGGQGVDNPQRIGAQLRQDGHDNIFYVDNNGSQGSMYGVIMNSVENAQNIGRILGCLYPEYVNQEEYLAYYYERFYHIVPGTNNATLEYVMQNALAGVWNYSAVDTDWSGLDLSTYNFVDVQVNIVAGINWLRANQGQAYVPAALVPTANV